MASAVVIAALMGVPARAQERVDRDLDGVLDVDELDADTDNDGLANVLDPDDDGDGVLTHFEYFTLLVVIDTDGDGTLDYLDADDDDDHILTALEEPDADRDGNPRDARETTEGSRDYLNEDDDNDTLLTTTERPNDEDRDTDMDGMPDHRDRDDDGDGRPTVDEIGGNPQRDTNGDGLLDYLDPDDDGDSIPTAEECLVIATIDVDRDGLINCLDLDSDGDGIPDSVEGDADRDGDGVPDYLQPMGGVNPSDMGQGNVIPGFESDAGLTDIDLDSLDGGVALDGATGGSDMNNGGSTVTVVPHSKPSGGCSLGAPGASDALAACLLALTLTSASRLRRRRGTQREEA